jgi:plasmid stabilization system protein ParE
MKIRITSYARRQIRLIFLYYKHAASIDVAKKIKKNITDSIILLQNFPETGQEEEYMKQYEGTYRRIIAGNYKIIYKIEKEEIIVTDIFDARQYPSGMWA